MAVWARDVAAEIRQELPGIPVKKLHKLLYYCQGYHLAWFGEALFVDEIDAWDMGPVVADLWRDEKYNRPPIPAAGPAMGDRELNTVGYVCSRFRYWTGRELEIQSHGEDPWRRADAVRKAGGSDRIDLEWIGEYFRLADAADRAEDPIPMDDPRVQAMLAGAVERLREPAREDTPEDFLRLRQRILAEMGSG